MGPLMRVMAAFGRSARMTPDQAADLTFELDEIAATLGADYDAVTAPVDFVVGSGRHAGSTAEQCQAMRDSVPPLAASHPTVNVFATVPASHTQILARHPDRVAAAVDDVARRAGLAV